MTSLHPVNVAVDDQLPHPDTLVLHNRPLRPGTDPAFLSVFADDRWVLTPAFFEEHQQAVSLNLAALPPRFQAAAKHYLWQQLNHPEPPVLPGSSTRHLAVRTVASGFQHLAAFLHWLDARAVARVADITSADLDTYLGHLLAAAVSTGTLFERVQEVRRLWAWRGRLPADARLPEEPPWRGDSPSAIVGRRRDHGQENRTARIHPATMDRLLGWALRFVDVFADDIIAAAQDYLELHQRTGRVRQRDQRRSPRHGGSFRQDLETLLAELRATGRPLPGRIAPDGRRIIAWTHLARMLDSHPPALTRNSALVEAAGIPVADAAYLPTPISGRLDGRPWLDRPIAYHEAERHVRNLSAACFVVIAYLSGMRPGEALCLRRGCVRYDRTAGLWLLHGRKWKGAVDETGAKRAQGEERTDPWVVVEPVARAVAVLERLHDGPLLFPTALLASYGAARRAGDRLGKARTSAAVCRDITGLVAWVNDYCVGRGRDDEQIPPDVSGRLLAPSRLRRTLAWFIVRRPRGLVAGAIQYGHLATQVTLGYSGTYASGFPDDHAFETWLLRLEQLAEAERRLTDGEHVSGPAADAYRERVHQANQQFAGRTLTSTHQAHTLLRNPALRVFPGSGMTCVLNPPTAVCQRDKPPSARRTPHWPDCNPACQNVARTDRDVAELRRQAAELEVLVADPLSPEPRHHRERQQLARLRDVIDTHEQGRAASPRPSDSAGD
jgi:hypothetical protein